MRAVVVSLLVATAAGLALAVDRNPAPAKPPAQQPAPTPSQGGTVTGTVEETIDASNYTYLRLKTASGDVWAAVGKAEVKKGARVTVVNAVPMDGFESKTLHRTFEHILFGTLAPSEKGAASPGVGSSALPPGHPATSDADMKSMSAAQHAAAAAGPSDVGPIKVTKASGTNGRTVSEIYAQKTALKGAEVAVRGKVVKYTPAVMGKNWIHLRDGSGSHEKGNDDITATTSGTAAVGDVVLVKGVVRLDRDFGAGYSYSVIIEDASLSK